MGLRDKQNAAARATAAWLIPANVRDNVISATLENGAPSINISSDLNSDCGYEGGVNCDWSDSDSEYDEDYTDTESLEDMDGDELDDNLQELKAELDDLFTPTKYDQIMEPKLTTDWKKAEQNRNLRYSGNSKCTQEWRVKEAHNREASRTKARTL